MLKSLHIHNYHSLVDFTLELGEQVLLVGSNGSGKSSVWEVLGGLVDLATRGRAVGEVFPTRTLTRWTREEGQRFVLVLEVAEEGTFTYEVEVRHDRRREVPVLVSERLSVEEGIPVGFAGDPEDDDPLVQQALLGLSRGDGVLYELIDGEVRLYGDEPTSEPRTKFPFNRRSSFIPELEARPDNQRLMAFREAMGAVMLLAPALGRLAPETSGEAPLLARNGDNFPSWWRGQILGDPELGVRLNEALRPGIAGFQRISFKQVSSVVRELVLQLRSEAEAYELAVSELSDGQRALLVLYGVLVAALERGQARVFFVDEPELGLAPHEMQPWVSAAAAALRDHGGQLIVSSHHPAIIDTMASTSTTCLSRPRGGRTVSSEITLETTEGVRVSDWLSRSWAYEDEHGE